MPPPESPDPQEKDNELTGNDPPSTEPEAGAAPNRSFHYENIQESVIVSGDGNVVSVTAPSELDEEQRRRSLEGQILAGAINDLRARLKAQRQPPPLPENPYKGSLRYDLSDAPLFFGRSEAIASLKRRLSQGGGRGRLVVLRGAIGSGKTSLLRAGFMPALLDDGQFPLLVEVSQEPLAQRIKSAIVKELHTTTYLSLQKLDAFLSDVLSHMNQDEGLFILLDQFENFFQSPIEAQEAFASQWADCLRLPEARLHWLVSIRSGKEAELKFFQERGVTEIFANSYALASLNHQEAEQAISKPAEAAGLEIESGLAAQILNDLGGERIEPSSLQRIMDSLANDYGLDDRRISLADYQAAGAAQGIIQNYLEIVMRRVDVADRQAAWQALGLLAEKQEQAETSEDLATELAEYGIDERQAARVLLSLEVNQLISKAEEQIRLASPGLLPSIRRWEDEQAAARRMRHEVARQLREVRNSALRGLLGGVLGFSLSFMLVWWRSAIPYDWSFFYQTMLRVPLGAIAGILITLLVDVAISSFSGKRKRLSWLVGALAGAFSFAFIFWLNSLPIFGLTLTDRLLRIAEGAIWGLAIGLGAVWVLSSNRPAWLTLFFTALAGGVALLLGEMLAGSFTRPILGQPPSPASLVMVFLAGAITPLFLCGAIRFGRRTYPPLSPFPKGKGEGG